MEATRAGPSEPCREPSHEPPDRLIREYAADVDESRAALVSAVARSFRDGVDPREIPDWDLPELERVVEEALDDWIATTVGDLPEPAALLAAIEAEIKSLIGRETQRERVDRWLRQLARGDTHAFEDVADFGCEHLHRHAALRYGGQGSARPSDIAQEAGVCLLRLLRRRPPADAAHFFSLCGVILTQSFLRERRRVARGQGTGRANPEPTDDSLTPDRLDPAQTTDDPLKLASWTEFHRYVAQLRRRYTAGDRIRGLSEQEFTVFTLKRFESRPPREIAALLNVSVRTVSNVEARAVRKLHSHLKDW